MVKSTQRYQRIKKAGGPVYEALLERFRMRAALQRAKNPKPKKERIDPEILRLRRNERSRARKAARRQALIEAGLCKKKGRPKLCFPGVVAKWSGPWKTAIVANARQRGRQLGLEGTITVADIVWPTHCPVLGIKLYYPDRTGYGGDARRMDRASLDRWDNTKGYVPGNVFVISFRANILKSDATAAELQAVANYARKRPNLDAPTLHLRLVPSSVRVA